MMQVTLKLKKGDSIFVKPAENGTTTEFPTEEIEGYLLKELTDNNNGEFSILSPPKPIDQTLLKFGPAGMKPGVSVLKSISFQDLKRRPNK